MNHFLVSCLESRIEEDGKLYGKFFIGPCNPGQGTTLGTALRRNLLSELSGIGIVAVEIKGADHEYCSLPGIRESVLDIILNLKGIALGGDIIPEEPCIGFLDVSGPFQVKAKHIRFPLGISPVKEDHHIATVSYNGNLSLKVFLIKGKNSMIHNPSTIPQVEGLKLISSISKKTGILDERKKNDILPSRIASNSKIEYKENKFHQLKTKIQLKSFWDEYSQKEPFSTEKRETSIYFDAFLELLEKKDLEYKFWEKNPNNFNSRKTKSQTSPIPSFQKRVLKHWKIRKNNLSKPRRSISQGFSNIFRKQESLLYSYYQSKKSLSSTEKEIYSPALDVHQSWKGLSTLSRKGIEESDWKRSAILPVDGLFLPVQKVNFRVETDSLQTKDHLILEIWTNGAVHPRQALYESAENLITILSHFHQCNPFLYRKNKSIQDENDYIDENETKWLSFNNFFEKKDLLEISDQQSATNEIISKSFYSLDIANIRLPLFLFIHLKKLNIHTIQDLTKRLDNLNLGEKEINILKNVLREIGDRNNLEE
jgi:DNA-directed RNA polymerase alpha subunit